MIPQKVLSLLKLREHDLDIGRDTLVMGILNITPDSFYDGGRHTTVEDSIKKAFELDEEGADIIDVGGESTRPGSEPVNADEEWRRIGPVVSKLALKGKIVSVDTYKGKVAKMALEAGASIINDISGGTFDPDLHGIVAEYGAGLVVMHIKGTPRTMQKYPSYKNMMSEILMFLARQTRAAEQAGVHPESIIIDPGIGFGKRFEHNLEIIRRLDILKELPYPILVGPSRKSFIGNITGLPPQERLEGSMGAAAAAAIYGADIVRVHDVKETKKTLTVVDAIRKAYAPEANSWR